MRGSKRAVSMFVRGWVAGVRAYVLVRMHACTRVALASKMRHQCRVEKRKETRGEERRGQVRRKERQSERRGRRGRWPVPASHLWMIIAALGSKSSKLDSLLPRDEAVEDMDGDTAGPAEDPLRFSCAHPNEGSGRWHVICK
jgi:hypothetical protein